MTQTNKFPIGISDFKNPDVNGLLLIGMAFCGKASKSCTSIHKQNSAVDTFRKNHQLLGSAFPKLLF